MTDDRRQLADRVLSGDLLIASPDQPLVSDSEMRRAVGELFDDAQDMIDNGTVTVVVLAARRLMCLYELLVELGMEPLRGALVVSDRYLEANPDLSRLVPDGRVDVLVLDDSVVVGTTLHRLHGALTKNLSPTTIRYRAVCRDEDQAASFLFGEMDFDCLLERPHEDVQTLSQELVVVLFAHLVPFFSDFPIGSRIDLDHNRLLDVLETTGWHVADVTAPGLHEWGKAVALIPTNEMFQTYLTRLLPQVAALVDAIKIRLYLRPTDDGYEVVPVPIAMLAPASPESLNDALSAIRSAGQSAGNQPILDCDGWRPEAKHRLVQMYAAAGAMAEIWPWLAEASPAIGQLDRNALKRVPVDLYFGPDADDVLNAFDHLVALYAKTPSGTHPIPPTVRPTTPIASILENERVVRTFVEARTLLTRLGMPDSPERGEITKLGTVIGHAVSAIFGDVDSNEEREQRQTIRALGSLDEYATWVLENERVLEQGFTLRDLVERLWPETAHGDSWTRALISLGIDEGNDLGIIVPITRYDESRDLAYRSYRLGETAQLASSPLVPLAFGAIDEPDRFVSAMQSGEARTETSTSPLAEAFTRDWFESEAAPVRPEARVKELLPLGRPIEQYAVRVDEIDVADGRFLATVDGLDADVDTVSFPISRIPDTRLATLAQGDRFQWTIFEMQDDVRKTRSSEIEVVPSWSIDLEALQRNAATLPSTEPGGDRSPR